MGIRRRRSNQVGCWLVLLFGSSAGLTQIRPHIAPEGPLSPQEQLEKFHLPPGFEIELVASEPDIYSPLSINFDARGRLWGTDTIEYPFPPKGPGRDGLKVFEDTDRDGKYDIGSATIQSKNDSPHSFPHASGRRENNDGSGTEPRHPLPP